MKKNSLLLSNSNSLAKSAGLLRLRARTVAQELKSGNFASMFKGQGIDFAGVREYFAGDDVRSIDWNVTARMGKAFVKLYEEEREQTVFIILDRSCSMETGSTDSSRLNIACETASILLFAAQINFCPVGAVLFDGKITFSCLPKKSKEHTMMLFTKFSQREQHITNGTVLSNAIKGASQILKKRSMIFVISDFKTNGYEENFVRLSQKHDVVAIRITDKNDFELPKAGLVRVRDPETHNEVLIPTENSLFKQIWRENYKNEIHRWKYMCKKNGIIPILISTADDPPLRLAKSLAVREKI